MKIDRRSFLSFLIGGAAGTGLSPLPWKITDDLSIWTQRWPWTPVPEDGEVSYVDSVCTLCPGGCGITVRKIEDRAVKIEGMKGHPINDGGICILGIAGLQLLYGPTRVKTPLKRKTSRGEGEWVQISWEEAIEEVARNLAELASKGQSHTVSVVSGSDRGTVPLLLERFLAAYGSPNFVRMPSMEDSYELTLRLMHGVQASAGFDIENADFILSFGSGVIEGWGSPVRMFKANSLRQEGNGKLIQIEPRLSNTAAKSDEWIPIKPGTEAALALGLAHVIIQESLYGDLVNYYSFGFNEFKQLALNEYSPDKVSDITGVEKTRIIDLARSFARASKPLAICGRGQGRTPVGVHECMAVHALNALVGNINKKGGVRTISEPEIYKALKLDDDSVATGMKKARIDGAGSEKFPHTRYLSNRFFEAVDSGKGYPVQALFVAGANPYYCMPDSEVVKKAFDKIPFVVSFSPYMDETAKNADLVLPNHAYLERYEDVPTPVGLQRPIIGLSKPVVAPQFDTRHVGDVIIQIAKVMGGNVSDAFPWDSYEACLEETLGDQWETLVEKGFWVDSEFEAPSWDSAFKTDSGKFEFFTTAIKTSHGKDIDALPHFNPVKLEGENAAFPLILIPYDSMRLANGFIGDPPFVIKTVEDNVLKGKDLFVEVNPKTAREQGLAEGKYAILSTPKGQVKVRVHLFEGVRPSLVAMPRGLGHAAYDNYLAGKGVNFNELIGPVEDPISGLDAAWGIRAKLTKA